MVKPVRSILGSGVLSQIIHRTGFSVCLLLAATVSTWAALSGMRTFTDVEGRTIQAELLSATTTEVRLRRDDGRVFDLSRSRLSDSDQKYIDDWITERAFSFGDLEVSAWRVRLGAKRTQTRSSLKSKEQWCYKMKLANKSRSNFKNLSINYRVFYREDDIREGKEEPPLKRAEGRISTGNLAAGDDVQLQTEAIALSVSQLRIGWKYSGTGKRRVEDSLEGIWFRVMSDERLIKEFASPSDLPRKQIW